MAVYKLAKQEGNKKYSILGGILIPITIAFLVFLILPMFSGNVLAPETYALMIAWSIIGLIYFNHIIRKDHTRKFGKAILVWVSLQGFASGFRCDPVADMVTKDERGQRKCCY